MSWDEFFFSVVDLYASKSKDRSTKVGCVIVDENNVVRSTGYNGFPRGVDDDVDSRHLRPEKYMWTEHAERNAIYNAAQVGVSLKDCRIYLEWYPCADCARAIIQSGISELVIDGRDYEDRKAYWDARWKDSTLVSQQMLEEAGVSIRFYKREE